ncbi:general secretion pathway protein GspB [Photobacterium kagoshimensis]|uniref:general secretion pathway protein GspB n=1 Tax=Photobacterium kagoshimensis TaxID=2910242 RepID=UPI003D111679
MSKLFSAIAQSEQNYQTQSTLTRPTYAQQQATPAAGRGWSSIALFALPVVAVVGYTLLQPYLNTTALRIAQHSATAHTTDTRTATLELTDSIQQASKVREASAMAKRLHTQHDVLPEVSFLPYPELITEALPEANWDQSRALVTNNTVNAAEEFEVNTVPSEPKVISAKPLSRQDDSWNLDKLDLSGLSPELASQLQSAIAATDSTTGSVEDSADFDVQSQQAVTPNGAASNTKGSTSADRAANAVMAIGDLPASVQQRLPTMNLQAHIYSSNAQSRWVKVNGREIFEGDAIAPGVTLRSIEPRQIVFDFENYRIAMPALSEW